MTKTDTKLVSVRLPMKDFERLQMLAEDSLVSVSQIIKTAIHVGLIIAESAFDERTQEEEENGD